MKQIVMHLSALFMILNFSGCSSKEVVCVKPTKPKIEEAVITQGFGEGQNGIVNGKSKIDYLGKIKDDVTTLKPGRFDIWEVDKWVEDIEAKNKYELQTKINESEQYLNKTDWVDSYKIRHDLGLELIPEDSSKWEVLNKREEYKLFLKRVK